MAEIARRTIIGAGTAAALTVFGSGPARAGARSAPASEAADAPRRGYAFLDAAADGYPEHGTIRLAQSYADQAGLFSTAFTYDNALAILAHLVRPGREGRARAVALGDALLYAQ